MPGQSGKLRSGPAIAQTKRQLPASAQRKRRQRHDHLPVDDANRISNAPRLQQQEQQRK